MPPSDAVDNGLVSGTPTGSPAERSRTVSCPTCGTVYQILQTGKDVHDDHRLCCPRCWRLEDGTPVWQRRRIGR